MSDVVVTVPKTFKIDLSPGKVGLAAWIGEGDPAGTEWSGQLWAYSLGPHRPTIAPGERVYIVCEGRVRGYSPLVRVKPGEYGFELIRAGGAVAVTIAAHVTGFRGFRYRWWERSDEVPFPEWETP